MKESCSLRRAVRERDLSLCWTMRIMGLLLAGAAYTFMQQDIFSSTLSQGFFAVCAALGAIMVVTSFLPGERKLRLRELQEKPILQPIVQRLPSRRRPA